MATQTDTPETLAERLVSWTIQGTWLFWLVGGLYIVGPALGWTLAGIAAWRVYERIGPAPGDASPLGASVVLVWIVGMLAMLVALVAGHALNGLGAAQTLKSAIGWAKGWALLAVYPAAAFYLDIRPQVLYRAICRLGGQTLWLLPIFLIAPFLGLPQTLYVSPLKIFGGSSSEFFAVVLYTIDPDAGIMRWQFFAPWSPAAGMVAVVHVLLALEESSARWRWVGVAAGLAIAIMSESRLALVALALAWPASHILARARHPAFWFVGGAGALTLGLFSQTVFGLLQELNDRFRGARPASSRVRATLGRIAIDRWQNEAMWFGHGVVERGPHLVEYMPIGSHHSWYGLLFVKGLVGLVALAVPLAYSLAVCLWLALRGPLGRVALAMLLVILMYSFGENLEVLGYLFWPALVAVGIAARRGAGSSRVVAE